MSVGLNRDGTGIISLDQVSLIRGLYSRIGNLWKSQACRRDGLVAWAGKAVSFFGRWSGRFSRWIVAFLTVKASAFPDRLGPVEKPALCALGLVSGQPPSNCFGAR